MRSKQIFKGHVTGMSISMSFFIVFFLNYNAYMFVSATFLVLNFDFTIFAFCYSIKYLGNINWEVLPLAKLVKPRLPRYF